MQREMEGREQAARAEVVEKVKIEAGMKAEVLRWVEDEVEEPERWDGLE